MRSGGAAEIERTSMKDRGTKTFEGSDHIYAYPCALRGVHGQTWRVKGDATIVQRARSRPLSIAILVDTLRVSCTPR